MTNDEAKTALIKSSSCFANIPLLGKIEGTVYGIRYFKRARGVNTDQKAREILCTVEILDKNRNSVVFAPIEKVELQSSAIQKGE